MDKAALLADIESKALKIVSTEEQADPVKNAANVKSYITNVLEQNGKQVQGRNIGWYTIDEGTPQEQAFYRDQVVPKNQARDAVIAYLDGVSPAPYIRYDLLEVNEENRSAKALAVKDNGDGTAKEVMLFIYKNGSNPIAHVELT